MFKDVLNMKPDDVCAKIENEEPAWEVDQIKEEIAKVQAKEEELN